MEFGQHMLLLALLLYCAHMLNIDIKYRKTAEVISYCRTGKPCKHTLLLLEPGLADF
jgi:hypothetical protein